MGEESVRDYVERSQQLIESSPQMDEQNTRTRLIDPFIRDVLNWDLYSTDIELEYSIQMGRTKKKVDYALMIDGTPKVFVEAKGCDTEIDDDGQLGSYMKQEWVDWGLLTNGKHFRVYKLQKQADSPSVELIGEATLEQIESKLWMLEALSKESIESGRSDTIYENLERRRRAVEALTDDKEHLVEQIREMVVDYAGDVVSQPAESLSKEFLNDLIDSLEKQTGDIVSGPKKPEPPAGQYQVLLSGTGQDEVFAASGQSAVMGKAVNHLIQNHDLIGHLPEFPYVPGEKQAILNDEPRHPDGEEMRLYQELDDGYYVLTSLNQDSKKRYISRFAKFCGLDVEYSGAW